jgi:hypothetical protein
MMADKTLSRMSYNISVEYGGKTHYIHCKGKPTAQFIVDAVRLKGAADADVAVWEEPGSDNQRCLKIDPLKGTILDEEETFAD